MKNFENLFKYIGEKTGITKQLMIVLLLSLPIGFAIGKLTTPSIESNQAFIELKQELADTKALVTQLQLESNEKDKVISTQQELLDNQKAAFKNLMTDYKALAEENKSHVSRLEKAQAELDRFEIENKYLKEQTRLLNQRLNDTSFIWE